VDEEKTINPSQEIRWKILIINYTEFTIVTDFIRILFFFGVTDVILKF